MTAIRPCIQSPVYHPSPAAKKFKPLENLAGYFLKICIFRDAALKGRCSQQCIAPASRGIINLWMKCRGIPDRLPAFDAKRLEKTNAFLSEFAEVRSAKAEDGTPLRWILYTPQRFQKWIEENGGVRDGDEGEEWIRPRTEQDWTRLQRLREFKWFEEVGHAFRVPPLIPNAAEKCVLRCQGFGRTMGMDKSFIGLHLAAGFNYALFDWREELSAKGFFQDAEAIYRALLREGFSPRQIKPMGSCRATFVVAHLKELHHTEGLDVVMSHTPPSLRSVIAHTMWPANKIGLLGLPQIEKDGVDFDTLRKFRSLPPSDSAACLIMSEGDQTVPPKENQELMETIQHIGKSEFIYEPKIEGTVDPHFGEPFRNPQVLQKYFQFLTRSVEQQDQR